MPGRPNILWIVTTQWRAQACGYAGDPNARTPWIDGLAAEAVNYAQAVTPHPLGPQARAALLTGIHSPQNGVGDYFDPLPADARTVAHALAARGYATAFFGKWHLAERDRSADFVGETHARQVVPEAGRGGFGFWEGFEGGFQLHDPWLHGTRLAEPRRFKGYQADILAERAAHWIAERARLHPAGEAPFFCVLSMEPPHPPYDAAAPHVRPARSADLVLRPNVPIGGEVEKKARTELAGYYAHIEATDRAIGRLLSEIELGETSIVFTSVHGDMHGSHGLFRKAWPYEESIRIPLLVRPAPAAGAAAGSVSDEPLSLTDLSHLAVAWAEGRPWRIRRDHAVISMPTATTIPLQCDRAWRGFRTAGHKLVLNADGTPWLDFDLRADPFEQHNLVLDPSRAREIADLAEGL